MLHGDETIRRCFPSLGNRVKPAPRPLRFIAGSVRPTTCARRGHLRFPYCRNLFPSRRFPFLFHGAAHESIWPCPSPRIRCTRVQSTGPLLSSPPGSSHSPWSLDGHGSGGGSAKLRHGGGKRARGQLAQTQGDLLACAAAVACILI